MRWEGLDWLWASPRPLPDRGTCVCLLSSHRAFVLGGADTTLPVTLDFSGPVWWAGGDFARLMSTCESFPSVRNCQECAKMAPGMWSEH